MPCSWPLVSRRRKREPCCQRMRIARGACILQNELWLQGSQFPDSTKVFYEPSLVLHVRGAARMNRRFILKSGGFTAMGLMLALPAPAKEDGKVGKVEADVFNKANEEAGAKVKALLPDDAALSDGDKILVDEIATGGMMQLQASELARERAKARDVKLIAEGEIAEQMGLAAKLNEFAVKKSVKLPTKLTDKGRKLMADLKAAGDDFDRIYLSESGVKGHEELKKTMTKVREKAVDGMLKALAETAKPLRLLDHEAYVGSQVAAVTGVHVTDTEILIGKRVPFLKGQSR
ncbi:MAG: DUF4142 domain-containing protein [Verrucomicrobiaceae bacterium]|nr:MAG: DUF4142 domain-containing protein [Verrucomicrobiaceae bacterium]